MEKSKKTISSLQQYKRGEKHQLFEEYLRIKLIQ